MTTFMLNTYDEYNNNTSNHNNLNNTNDHDDNNSNSNNNDNSKTDETIYVHPINSPINGHMNGLEFFKEDEELDNFQSNTPTTLPLVSNLSNQSMNRLSLNKNDSSSNGGNYTGNTLTLQNLQNQNSLQKPQLNRDDSNLSVCSTGSNMSLTWTNGMEPINYNQLSQNKRFLNLTPKNSSSNLKLKKKNSSSQGVKFFPTTINTNSNTKKRNIKIYSFYQLLQYLYNNIALTTLINNI